MPLSRYLPIIFSVKAKELGFSGETLAAHYLQNKGYEILRRNFTIRGGEIDLIAKQAGILVFVEVKTRTNKNFGAGDESINKLKKRRLARTIQRYLDTCVTAQDPDYRVDVVEIELHPVTKKIQRITHFEDIEL